MEGPLGPRFAAGLRTRKPSEGQPQIRSQKLHHPPWHWEIGSGWWLTYPPEEYEFVNWDDDIPNIYKNKK